MRLHRRETILTFLAAAFVLTALAAVSLAPFARANSWAAQPGPVGWQAAGLGLVWLACAVVAGVWIRRALPRHDAYLLPVAYLLAGWGLATIWRLAPGFALRQAAWLVVATAALIGIAVPPGILRWLRRYRYTWLLCGLILTLLTLLFGVNPSGYGQRLWLGLGSWLYLQPAEILKVLLVVFLAAYLADRREVLFRTAPPPGQRRLTLSWPAFPYFFPLLLMWGFSMLVLVSQRDLGMSTLFFAVFLTMLYLASGQMRYVVLGVGLLLVGAFIGYFLFDVVRLRVEAWWDPWQDASGRSFQIVQSLIAFAAGGLAGQGPGLGAPTLIPVAHSDFIFAALAEEWGVAGAVGVVCLIGIVIFRGLRIALAAQGAFQQLLAGGLAALLGVQALMIMGGVVKIVPLTGLTLPFMSYGGSSLVASFCLLGLLLRLSVTPPAP
jgi:cell division protein FtsW (lipid II flippase)